MAKKKKKEELQSTITLSQEQQQKILEENNKCATIKCNISDLTEQIIIAERQRSNMYDELYQAQNKYKDSIIKIAKESGIDVNGAEAWEFNFEKMEFVKRNGN